VVSLTGELIIVTSRIDLLDAALARSEVFWLEINELDTVQAFSNAADLQPGEWSALAAIWRSRPLEWQRCLATVLAEVAPTPAVAWLLEMIERGEDALSMHAIDALRSLQAEHDLGLAWPAPVLRRVRELWSRHRGFTARQLEQLLEDMALGVVPGGRPRQLR
jgi:hypothetical protein